MTRHIRRTGIDCPKCGETTTTIYGRIMKVKPKKKFRSIGSLCPNLHLTPKNIGNEAWEHINRFVGGERNE